MVTYRKVRGKSEEAAQSLAIEALGFLASDMERLEPFLSLSGLDPSRLREAAAQPGFLPGVLDYICSNERLLLAFAGECGCGPEAITRAQAILSGPPPEWGA